MTILSLASVLAEAARRYPDKTAIVDPYQRVTYAELWQQARAYAAGLRELGVKPGDAVALQCPNLADFPRAYYGILAAGAAVVPVHLLLTPDEIAYVLKDSGATLLISHAAVLQNGAPAAGAAGIPLVTLGPVPADVPVKRLEEVSASVPPLPLHVSREAEDPAVIFYTSGTTGEPKGAVLSHLNLVLNATVNAFDNNDVSSSDIALGALPLFHTYGQTVSMNASFRIGMTVILLPRFTGDAAIDVMIKENVTIFHGVPTMYVALLEAAAGRTELPAVRVAVSGGAALPVVVLEKFKAVFGSTIFEGYGLSETSPTATTNQPHFGTRPGTVGHAIWGVDVEIARAEVEDSIELLPAGELGEIVIRGHNIFTGYIGRPEATAEAVIDGWFRTGDLGTKSADGFITIVDRKKDLVIRGGFNVYPREVEEVLARHPGVTQVAVIGVPDPVHGEEIMAVVIPHKDADAGAPTEEELIEYAKEHLGRHKYPRQVRFVDELPMGPSMKVLKRQLRKEITA